MRIPDGDLMPARRRRYGGGYGRRRRRTREFAVLGAVVLVVALVGLYASRKGTPAVVTAPCPKPSATPRPLELPAPREVRVTVLNGTPRAGLARQVADALTAQGFVVVKQDNASAALGGASEVSYGTGARPSALVVSFRVPGSVLVSDPAAAAGSVTLVLGGDFRRLATPAEVAAALQAAGQAAAVPAPTGPTPSPTCRA